MKIALIRRNVSSQIFLEKWESFTWYQILVTGCEGKTKSKMKTFSNLGNAQRYITRLYDGKWISTVEYDRAYRALLVFEEVNEYKISPDHLEMSYTTLNPSWMADSGSATRADIA